MGTRPGTQTAEPVLIAETTGRLIAPDALVSKVENLVPTDDGGYTSAYQPIPYQYEEDGGVPGDAPDVHGGIGLSPDPAMPRYGETRGIFHCLLKGGARDVLLLHTKDQVWVHDGPSHSWRVLIGPEDSTPELEAELVSDGSSAFPTQFVATPTGVVIIPQGSRAYFYDGHTVAPLGYDHAPSAPIGLGPESSEGEYTVGSGITTPGVNDVGYAMDALDDRPSAMRYVFKRCRIGTVTTPGIPSVTPEEANQILGYLQPGRWRARVQWVDQWGNLSPLSGPSNDVVFERQPSTGYQSTANYAKWVSVDKVTKQIAWDGLRPGPNGTIGRIIYRTKDLINSGSADYWELPLNATTLVNAYATLPDNESTMYPDNIPDAWLTAAPVEVVPVPTFKLAALAFGRLWIANMRGEPGLLRPSLVGRWGTFPVDLERYPDPTGAEITGLIATAAGLVVTTATSTFIITENDAGDDFKARTITTTTGCVAPSSMATMQNGITVWLAREGFVAFDGQQVVPLWGDRVREAKRISSGRARAAVAVYDARKSQYKCWVPEGGSGLNARCWKYDGTSWHEEDIVAASGACVTRDHRRWVIVCGRITDAEGGAPDDDGVWIMDHGDSQVRSGKTVTGWIRGLSSSTRSSIVNVRLWVRETGKSSDDDTKIVVSVRKNWRSDIVSTERIEPYMPVSAQLDPTPPPDFVGDTDTTWGSAVVRRRRPFWVVLGVHVPSCETFQLELSSVSGRFEIIGYTFGWQDRDDGGARAR